MKYWCTFAKIISMQRLYIEPTKVTPEIHLSPDENIFLIRGESSPENVRSLYYPVIEWIKIFIDDVIEGEYPSYARENPLRFQTDLAYFNSSSAKFFFDIFIELKRLINAGIPVVVEWLYDNDDPEQKEAGEDISRMAGMEFTFISKNK
jgi:hypothetical protein